MSLSIGIIGLPNVGKSTLFNALLKRQAALAANYPFATIEPNVGIVDVPDPRLNTLVDIVKKDYSSRVGDREVPEKVIPATVKFYDIAGLVKGAAHGEGLGNAFLGHIREVDALVHVVRAFTDDNVIRAGSTTPSDDIATINTELILSDLQLLDKSITRVESELKSKKTPSLQKKLEILNLVKQKFDAGILGTQIGLSQSDLEHISDINFLTFKPAIYVFNIAEEDLGTNNVQTPATSFSESIKISAKIESEIASISDLQEKQAFLDSLNITESGLDQIIRKGYELLGLQTFFTMGPKEVHAWTITKGSTAPQAAGKIHTDFERGFISAQIISFADLASAGSEKLVRQNGTLRLEGKTYIMHDGDVVEFNFSV